jgi:dolichol kinase
MTDRYAFQHQFALTLFNTNRPRMAVQQSNTMMTKGKGIGTLRSRNEILRKLIHIGGFVIPILSNLVGLLIVTTLILTVTLFYVVSEWARIKGKNLPIASSITRHAAREGELDTFATAPVFFALGISLALLLFPAPASSAAIAAFAVGDSTASIFGRMFGKHTLPFNKGKTYEGSLSGFFFAFLAAALFINPFGALMAAAIAMVIESLPLPLSDNLVVPLITGATLTFIL